MAVKESRWNLRPDPSPIAPLESLRYVRFFRARRHSPDAAIALSLQHFSLDAPDLQCLTALLLRLGRPHAAPLGPVVIDGEDDNESHCRCRVLARLLLVLALVCNYAVAGSIVKYRYVAYDTVFPEYSIEYIHVGKGK